ncbi:MAG: cell division protein ZapA [Clostridiales bacterium]|jgi:cell division protein ZapA|nr:cell division protein ZapA [Clostridiales bacterium]MDK2932958.1 cell division protein ZapA [Clostridiales bacterium]
MASRNKVNVRINGKDYTIVGIETEEYIQKVALYIDKKMNQIISSNNKLSTSMAAVLTAINVGDDYFKCLDAMDNLQNQLQQCTQELDESNAQLHQYKKENEALKQEVQQLRIELVKKETELNDFINTFDHSARDNTVKIDNVRKVRAK